jgi:hypothetical protein
MFAVCLKKSGQLSICLFSLYLAQRRGEAEYAGRIKGFSAFFENAAPSVL